MDARDEWRRQCLEGRLCKQMSKYVVENEDDVLIPCCATRRKLIGMLEAHGDK